MLKAVLIILVGLASLFFLSGCYVNESTHRGMAHNLHHNMVVRRDLEGIHKDIDWIIRAHEPCTLRADFAR